MTRNYWYRLRAEGNSLSAFIALASPLLKSGRASLYRFETTDADDPLERTETAELRITTSSPIEDTLFSGLTLNTIASSFSIAFEAYGYSDPVFIDGVYDGRDYHLVITSGRRLSESVISLHDEYYEMTADSSEEDVIALITPALTAIGVRPSIEALDAYTNSRGEVDISPMDWDFSIRFGSER